MSKFSSLLPSFALAISVASIVSSAEGAIVFSDEFVYGTGTVVGQNGGIGFSGAYTSAGAVVSPGMSYDPLTTAGNGFQTASNNNGAFRNIPSIDTNSGTLWVSFLEATNGTVPDYAGLSFFNGGTEELFLGKPSGTSNYGFDVSGVGGGVATTGPAATSSPTFLLYRLTFTNAGETIDFYANNTPGTAPTTPTTTFSIPEGSFGSTFTGIRLQSGNQPVSFDEIRAGTTYADVAPVPEPASAALLVGAGALFLARRRRTAVLS